MVIEKVVYVEKPVAAPVRKARPTHLRAVPDTMSLPFFDEPPARFTGLICEKRLSQKRRTCCGTSNSVAASLIVRKASGDLMGAPAARKAGAAI
jgi:hypothetical protein